MLVGVEQGGPPLPPQGTSLGPQRPCLPAAGPRDRPHVGQASWSILTPDLTGTAKDPGFPHLRPTYPGSWSPAAGPPPPHPLPAAGRKRNQDTQPPPTPPEGLSQEQSRGLRSVDPRPRPMTSSRAPWPAYFPEGRGAGGGGPRSAEPSGSWALFRHPRRPAPEARPVCSSSGGNQAHPGLAGRTKDPQRVGLAQGTREAWAADDGSRQGAHRSHTGRPAVTRGRRRREPSRLDGAGRWQQVNHAQERPGCRLRPRQSPEHLRLSEPALPSLRTTPTTKTTPRAAETAPGSPEHPPELLNPTATS